jgi:Cyclic nucleotide-binding domain
VVLTTRPGRFAGTMDFVHLLLLMAEEAGTMGFIRDHAQVRWYPPGSYVIEQGEVSTELFVILSGHADVWQEQADGSRKQLRRIGPGEFFGELGVAGRRPRSAHVVAAEELTCLALSLTAPTPFAGRGEGARLPGQAAGPSEPAGNAGSAGDAGADAATARLDVTDHIEAKVGALCAYRASSRLSRACSLTSCSRSSSAGSTSSRCCRRAGSRPSCSERGTAYRALTSAATEARSAAVPARRAGRRRQRPVEPGLRRCRPALRAFREEVAGTEPRRGGDGGGRRG